ncbi:hypothetical protein BpHYR1_030001 [Brachionus plicatilis]|uniref:RNA-directed DNA polymerase from mobile element jockey-like n=1 Tax=Brachionus plicatilis TaxID=10195 RepID=A0A3M7QV69_BRAPC|nr:hypothetical protein BpHYR1_030001 [Brachionus plicatilis]
MKMSKNKKKDIIFIRGKMFKKTRSCQKHLKMKTKLLKNLTMTGNKLDTLISETGGLIEELKTWCYFNKVDINWEKTFFMKKIEVPDFIHIKEVTIKVVDNFKLLGFTIDNRLNIMKLVSETCLSKSSKGLLTYGLFAIQHRALERKLSFSYKIIKMENSPIQLKEQLVTNESRKIEYDLRNKSDFMVPKSKTKSGENTFGYVFTIGKQIPY